jgi:hypothetical protein
MSSDVLLAKVSFRSWDEYVDKMRAWGLLKKKMPIAIGWDLCRAESLFGERYTQAADETGYDAGTLANFKWVASRISQDEYSTELTFGQWQAIAPLDRKDRDNVVEKVLEVGLNREGTRLLVAQIQGKNMSETLKTPQMAVSAPWRASLKAIADLIPPYVALLVQLGKEKTPSALSICHLDEAGDALVAAHVRLFEHFSRPRED